MPVGHQEFRVLELVVLDQTGVWMEAFRRCRIM